MADAKVVPLSGPPPREIPLPRAPLVRVIAQVHFPILLVIKEEKNLSAFQERVRDEYPLLNRDEVQNARIEMSPSGANVQSETSAVYRFSDEDNNWRISLAPDFVALETKQYTSRNEFLERLMLVLGAVVDTYKPKLATRVGLRYVDQLKDEAFTNAGALIEKGAMGLAALVNADRINQAASEISLKADEGDLHIRWVQLQARTTYDPGVVEPINTDSWVLDLDLSSKERHSFDVEHLNTVYRSLTERVYSIFRFMITDKFLDYYGGKT